MANERHLFTLITTGGNTVCDQLTWYVVVMYTVPHVQAMLQNLKHYVQAIGDLGHDSRTTGNVGGNVAYEVKWILDPT